MAPVVDRRGHRRRTVIPRVRAVVPVQVRNALRQPVAAGSAVHADGLYCSPLRDPLDRLVGQHPAWSDVRPVLPVDVPVRLVRVVVAVAVVPAPVSIRPIGAVPVVTGGRGVPSVVRRFVRATAFVVRRPVLRTVLTVGIPAVVPAVVVLLVGVGTALGSVAVVRRPVVRRVLLRLVPVQLRGIREAVAGRRLDGPRSDPETADDECREEDWADHHLGRARRTLRSLIVVRHITCR